MQKYLFLFSISPVQSFISQARKTRDLYAGSRLLSHLISLAMERIGDSDFILSSSCFEECGIKINNIKVEAEVILPDKSIVSKPNRFLAKMVLKGDELSEDVSNEIVKCMGEKLEKSVRDEFRRISCKQLESFLYNKHQSIYHSGDNKKAYKEKLKSFAENVYRTQIDNHLYVYWVAIPFIKRNSNDKLIEDYEETYKTIERALGAIKSVTPFPQMPELGRKCSICGERNVVVYRLRKKKGELENLKSSESSFLRKLYMEDSNILIVGRGETKTLYSLYRDLRQDEVKHIQQGEGLCAVCFTKRMWNPQENDSLENRIEDDRESDNCLGDLEDIISYEERNDSENSGAFPSTAEIASLDWVEDVKNAKGFGNGELAGSEVIELYKECWHNFDPQMFYEENLDKHYIARYDRDPRKDNIKALCEKLDIDTNDISLEKEEDKIFCLKKCLHKLYNLKVKESEVGRPCKYYAVVMLDGDRMGEWLSGEHLESQNGNSNLQNFHIHISEYLGKYAQKVYKAVGERKDGNNSSDSECNKQNGENTNMKGRVIYAGGDDALVFVNLRYLWKVLKKLNEEFHCTLGKLKHISQEEKKGSNFQESLKNKEKKSQPLFKIKSGKKFTISCGIAIAHYKTPLSIVLQQARAMEKVAKDEGNRNAFAIALLKHSGEIHKTVWKWEMEEKSTEDSTKENGEESTEENTKNSTISIIEDLIEALQDEREGFSSNFISSLEREFQKIKDLEETTEISYHDILRAELKRLLYRSSYIQENKKRKQEISKWNSALMGLVEHSSPEIPQKQLINNFFALLNICDFLVRRSR